GCSARGRGGGVAARLLGGQHFQHMAIRVKEVEAAATATVVDRHVVQRARPTAVGDALLTDPVENIVERRLVYLEGVVVAFEFGLVVEVQRQRVIDLNRSEV